MEQSSQEAVRRTRPAMRAAAAAAEEEEEDVGVPSVVDVVELATFTPEAINTNRKTALVTDTNIIFFTLCVDSLSKSFSAGLHIVGYCIVKR